MYLVMLLFMCCLFPAVYSGNEECDSSENKYSAERNKVWTKEEMFQRGHMKPFGSHRPPKKVETLKYMISPQDFYMDFVTKHKPVVFKKVTQSWPAHTLWTDEYLTEKYGDSEMHMETKDDDKFNIPGNKIMKEFLKVYKEKNLYMVDEVTPEMREEVHLPLCLQCEEIDRFFFVSYYWHSIGGTMSTVHIDTDENLLCVIKGHKKVLMVSPVYTHDLYADGARQMGVLDVNSSSVDLEKYPRIMNVEYYEALVEEGDCVYIPQMWWHQVYSRKERQQAIAMWWKSKPFWKVVADSDAKSVKLTQDKQREHSYGDSLIDYEYWVQNVSSNLPPIKCKEQHKKMSKYMWETDKDENAPPTLGDNGDLEEEMFEHYRTLSPVEISKATKKAAQLKQRMSCDFDYTNKKSPCHIRALDEDDERFVRYVMDYCKHYEDRGCVINKPQILNKLFQEDFQKMAFKLKSKFKP